MDDLEAQLLLHIRCLGPCRKREMHGRLKAEKKAIGEALVSLFDKGLIEWIDGGFVLLDVTEKGRQRCVLLWKPPIATLRERFWARWKICE